MDYERSPLDRASSSKDAKKKEGIEQMRPHLREEGLRMYDGQEGLEWEIRVRGVELVEQTIEIELEEKDRHAAKRADAYHAEREYDYVMEFRRVAGKVCDGHGGGGINYLKVCLFQEKHGLHVDGLIGPETIDAAEKRAPAGAAAVKKRAPAEHPTEHESAEQHSPAHSQGDASRPEVHARAIHSTAEHEHRAVESHKPAPAHNVEATHDRPAQGHKPTIEKTHHPVAVHKGKGDVYDHDATGHDSLGNPSERIDPNKKAPSASGPIFTNSFTVIGHNVHLLDDQGKKSGQVIPEGTRVFVHKANENVVQIVTADHSIKETDNKWLMFSSLGGHGSNVALGNEKADAQDKTRADTIRDQLPPGRNPGHSRFKWTFAGNFLPSLDGISLDSSLMAKVHKLMEWAVYNDMVTGDIVINSGMRSPKKAQTMCVAYEILHMKDRKNVTMEALKALPNGTDANGVQWFKKGDEEEDIVQRAHQHTGGHVAAAGYPHGDPRRLPLALNTGPGVSRHCTGHAVDVTIPWRNATGDGTDVWGWEHTYHQFGLTRPLHKDLGVAASLQENWHIEETDKPIIGGNSETE